MAVQLLRIREFTPDAGNADLSPNEKIKVYLRSVDVYAKQTHIREFLGKTGQELMKDMMSNDGSKKIKEILAKNIVRFENLEVVDEPKSGETTIPEPRTATFDDVWALGEWQLCLEIFTNILNSSQLTKDEVKNSNSQSGLLQTPVEQVTH